jgi:hypothetical protein
MLIIALCFLFRLLTEEDFRFRYGVDEVHFSDKVSVWNMFFWAIAIFLRRRADRSDKIVEVIIKKICFQYEGSLAAWSIVEWSDFYRLTKSDSDRKSPQ